ncbi:FHA domain-containing protein [Thalassotalea maritima]|uniref:FHA domain-containing protein n=1 Tax=Thalassotalea maritima TaxID=3242416 RepID=UPI003528D858
MELIIEEISRGKKIKNRHKFATDEVHIGRGFQNDIILSDPHVCSEHLNLRFEHGQWLMQDMQSVNGTQLDNKQPVVGWQPVQSGDIVHLGKTRLRLFFANHPVAKSVAFTKVERFVERLGSLSWVIAMVAIFALITFALNYLQIAVRDVNYGQLTETTIYTTLAYAMWPLLCSLMAFMNKNEARVGSQLGVSFFILNLFWLIDFADRFLAFNSSSLWQWGWLTNSLYIVTTFMLFWFNLYIAFSQSNKRRSKVAALLTLLIYGGLYLNDLTQQPEFNAYPSYDSTIMMPSLSIKPAADSAQFNNNTDQLFEQVSKASQQPKADANKQ